MKTRLIRGEDGALSDALVGVLGRLRGPSYASPQGGPEQHGPLGADGFVDRLVGHFRHAETTLFPALRKDGSGSPSEIEELQRDHWVLGLYARDLVDRLGHKDREGAYQVARSFLAVLLYHLRRENSDRIEGE